MSNWAEMSVKCPPEAGEGPFWGSVVVRDPGTVTLPRDLKLPESVENRVG